MLRLLDTRAGFIAQAERALLPEPEAPRRRDDGASNGPVLGDHRVAGFAPDMERISNAVGAAVLVPVTFDDSGGKIILTERSHKLRKHAGQVAFPGGRIDAGESALESALREAEEEIGLSRDHVTPLGYLPNYYTGTGYRMTPVVALVEHSDGLVPNPDEVERIFTAPLNVLFDLDRYRFERLVWEGRERQFFVVDHPDAYIWGATAALCRLLFERLRDA